MAMRPLDPVGVKRDCAGASVLGAAAYNGDVVLFLSNGAAVLVSSGSIAVGDEAETIRSAIAARLMRAEAEMAAFSKPQTTARDEASMMRRSADLAEIFGEGLELIGLPMSDVERRARTERLMRELD